MPPRRVANSSVEFLNYFWSLCNGTDGHCWEWQGGAGNRFGHGRVSLGRSQDEYAHRLAWMLCTGQPIPNGLCVLHHCDNPPCGNPEHLFLGTKADNNADREAKGRSRTPAPFTRRRDCGHPVRRSAGGDILACTLCSTIAKKLSRPEVSPDELADMPPREAMILARWSGVDLDRAESLEEIGGVLGLTRQRVAQIKDRALERLRRRRLAQQRASCQEKSA